MKVGRCEGLTLVDMSESGDLVAINALYVGDDVNTEARRQQLLGHIGETVPVLVDDESCTVPLQTGYYTLQSASSSLTGDDHAATVSRYSMVLRRVANGFVEPIIELVVNAATRDSGTVAPAGETASDVPPGTHPFTTSVAQGGAYFPAAATFSTVRGAGYLVAPRGTETGDLDAFPVDLTSPYFDSFVAQYSVAPADYYNGSCLIEVYGSDSVWRPVTGRQLPTIASTDELRMTNGAIRATWGQTGSTMGPRVRLEMWGDSGYETSPVSSWVLVDDYALSAQVSATLYGLEPAGQPRILRNDAHTISIAFVCETSNETVNQKPQYDMTIHRGDWHVIITPRQPQHEIIVTPENDADTADDQTGNMQSDVASTVRGWAVGGPGYDSTESDWTAPGITVAFDWAGPDAPIMLMGWPVGNPGATGNEMFGAISVTERFVT